MFLADAIATQQPLRDDSFTLPTMPDTFYSVVAVAAASITTSLKIKMQSFQATFLTSPLFSLTSGSFVNNEFSFVIMKFDD